MSHLKGLEADPEAKDKFPGFHTLSVLRCFYVSMAADYQLFLSVPRGISTSVISQPRPWRSQAMSRGCACFKCVIILLTATSRWNAQVLSLGTNPGVLHFPGANSDLVSLVSLRPDMTCCISSMESRIR